MADQSQEPLFPIHYEPVMLIKETERRTVGNRNEEALKSAKGIQSIISEEGFGENCFFNLFPTRVGEQQHRPKCELLIVVTMYNESSKEFVDTLEGVNKNLKEFVDAGIDPERIGCVVIVDGMEPLLKSLYSEAWIKQFKQEAQDYTELNKERNATLRRMKEEEMKASHLIQRNEIIVEENKSEENIKKAQEKAVERKFFFQFFDEEMIKEKFHVHIPLDCKLYNQNDFEENSGEFSHLFTQKIRFNSCEYALNFAFCIKQKNAKKLNTHLWFFGGFCETIQPKHVLLLDVGTKPLENSIFPLYEALELDDHLAGCCGEIKPMASKKFNIVISAQIVEYKFAHILDKALESLAGYITVLPGAFSAYRWEALKGNPLDEDYFKSIYRPKEMDAFQSNIYLAEDRVLCLSLISKKGKKYTLRYVRASVAETDVPNSITKLMVQRRRWINGSSFALVDAIRRFKKIYESNHSQCRKLVFTMQMVYYFLNVIFSWLIVGGFCLALVVALRKSKHSSEQGYAGTVMIVLYVSLLLIIFISSLGVKPHRFRWFYRTAATIMGIFQFYVFYLVTNYMVVQAINDTTAKAVIVACALGGSFSLVLLVNFEEILNIMKNLLQYVFLIPTYINIFLIYAICNVHDCTWGNRPDKMSDDEKKRLDEFEEFRARWAVAWVLCNSAFAYGISELEKQNSVIALYIFLVISFAGIAIMFLRVIGGIFYRFYDPCKKKKIKNPISVVRNTGRIIKEPKDIRQELFPSAPVQESK